MERKTGLEPATLSLARRCSTTEPLPPGAERQNRTADTAIFSRVLYQLSYLGPPTGPRPGIARVARGTRSILCAFWACQGTITPPRRRACLPHAPPRAARRPRPGRPGADPG